MPQSHLYGKPKDNHFLQIVALFTEFIVKKTVGKTVLTANRTQDLRVTLTCVPRGDTRLSIGI